MITGKKLFQKKSIERTHNLLAGLTKEAGTEKESRGFRAEEKALKAAKYWEKKKLIKRVRQPEGFSPEDRRMRDLVLTLLDGKEIGIQVKDYCKFSAVQKCREEGVWFFWVWEQETDEEIAKQRMLSLILSAYALEVPPGEIKFLNS